MGYNGAKGLGYNGAKGLGYNSRTQTPAANLSAKHNMYGTNIALKRPETHHVLDLVQEHKVTQMPSAIYDQTHHSVRIQLCALQKHANYYQASGN